MNYSSNKTEFSCILQYVKRLKIFFLFVASDCLPQLAPLTRNYNWLVYRTPLSIHFLFVGGSSLNSHFCAISFPFPPFPWVCLTDNHCAICRSITFTEQ